MLYLGRVDRNKGCDSLLEYFQTFADVRTRRLVLAGPAKMPIPAHPRIRALGYVPDDLRDALLAGARALIVPSPYESLSIALLQGWNHGVPALVNARCRVLDGQVRRANGGLSYRSGASSRQRSRTCSRTVSARDAFGRQGLAYVDREYRWPTSDRTRGAFARRCGESDGAPLTLVPLARVLCSPIHLRSSAVIGGASGDTMPMTLLP